MKKKPIRISPKKGGNGYVTSYSVNIGCAEARDCGFVAEDKTFALLEKIIDPENGRIIIQVVKEV